jgi:hypothetical protein
VLPLGWTKPAGAVFSHDAIYGPSYSGAGDSIAHANEFRDSGDYASANSTNLNHNQFVAQLTEDVL